MTVKGIRQTITAVPFGSEGGMALKINKENDDVITIPINEHVSWLNKDGKRIDGHVYSENQILVEEGDSVKVVTIDNYGEIEYKNAEGKEERGILVIIENNFDIKYSAMDLQALHSNLYLSCFIPENGQLGSIKVGSERNIEISPCSGMIDGLGFQILAKQNIKLSQGGSKRRIDSIVLRKDQVNRRISIDVLKGEESNNPKPKALQRDKFSTYEMLICTVIVDKNAVEITQGQLNDKRITLDNYYGADYLVETYQDLINLSGNKNAKNVILMADIELNNEDKIVNGVVEVSDVVVNIPETLETFRSLNNSTIKGVITFNGGEIERVRFSGVVNALNTKFKNCIFDYNGKVNASNTKFENCVFDNRYEKSKLGDQAENYPLYECICNFSSSCYVDDGLIGEIRAFAGEANKIPKGWLLCNGIDISRNSYSALFSVIGTNWGTGDGSATFNIPDARSGVLKGVGTGVLTDPDREGRFANKGGSAGDKVGSYQRYAFQYQSTHHSHGTQRYAIDWSKVDKKEGLTGGRFPNFEWLHHSSGTFGVDLTYGTGNSTRDNNIAVNFIIKAK